MKKANRLKRRGAKLKGLKRKIFLHDRQLPFYVDRKEECYKTNIVVPYLGNGCGTHFVRQPFHLCYGHN